MAPAENLLRCLPPGNGPTPYPGEEGDVGRKRQERQEIIAKLREAEVLVERWRQQQP